MGSCKERWAEREFKYQDSFSGHSATFLHLHQRQVGLSFNYSGNYGWTVSKKDPAKEQLEDDPGEISCRPQIQTHVLCPAPGQRNCQPAGEEGGAYVCRRLAISMLIVKMSGGCAKQGEGNTGWAGHSPCVSLSLASTHGPLEPPTPTTLVSPCPPFHGPQVINLWYLFQPLPFFPRLHSSGSETPGVFPSASVLLAHCS